MTTFNFPSIFVPLVGLVFLAIAMATYLSDNIYIIFIFMYYNK